MSTVSGSGNSRPCVALVSSRADVGGGPEHVLKLLRGLRDQCVFLVACPREAPYWGRYAEVVGEANMLAIGSRSLRPADLLRLRAFVRARGASVLHSHGHGAGVLARLCVPGGVPVIHTHHGLHFGGHAPGLRRSALLVLQRVLERRTALSVFVSGDESHAARRLGLARRRSVVIRNGVEVPVTPRRLHGQPGAPLRIATVSRFNRQKNPEGLLAVVAALAALDAGRDSFAVDVFGDGPERSRFEAALNETGLAPMVRLHGTVPDLGAALAGSDVFFSSSRWEGLPLSVLEAMGLGLPVVLSEVDGHGDILAACAQGAQGYALEQPAAAAAALQRLRDPALRAGAGAAARDCIGSCYSLETMLQQTLHAYRACLETKH